MRRGFDAVGKALAGQGSSTLPGQLLIVSGKTLVSTVGGASVNFKPKFEQGGTDITGNLPQLGVTLGQDLQGKYRPSAIGGGVGVVMPFGQWYADVGLRFTSINTTGQRSNLTRLLFGFGRRF